jgi:uncharacterized protein YndB with AHSA1/START domain
MSRTDVAIRVISAAPDRVFAALTDPTRLPGPLRDRRIQPAGEQDAHFPVGEVVARVKGGVAGDVAHRGGVLAALYETVMTARVKRRSNGRAVVL